jgi:predicted dehydrogenase
MKSATGTDGEASRARGDILRVAVLGTGRMGKIHLAALAKFRDDGLTVGDRVIRVEPALYGRDPVKVRDVAAEFGVARTSTDLNELVDAPDVDVIDNCLVNSLHHAPLMRGIRNGKHVFSEKPLTIELGEAVELLAAARAAGVHHGVIQNMRFNPGPHQVKVLID